MIPGYIIYVFPFGWQGINSIKRAVIKECDGKKGTYELAVEGLVILTQLLYPCHCFSFK